MSEWLIHFEYGSSRKGRVRFQYHLMGPSGASNDDAIKEARKLENKKAKLSPGWKVKEISWSKGEGKPKRKDPISEVLRKAALDKGSVSIGNRKGGKIRK